MRTYNYSACSVKGYNYFVQNNTNMHLKIYCKYNNKATCQGGSFCNDNLFHKLFASNYSYLVCLCSVNIVCFKVKV